ncbi:3-deoxy-D-manno-octulosonic acid kinase [Desulfuromonas sp. AOP6]|nr:3-deoxy-D-manno-octulosonic acid kinase [Desulfuromonas sp. AOP6]
MAGIMTSELDPRIVRSGNRHILYDAARIAKPSDDIFDPEKLAAGGFLVGKALGRGEAYFLRYQGQDWVLRHYRRGGLVAKLFHDHYLGWHPGRSRAWREWRLLAVLYAQGLPVPRPVAASVVSGFGVYRADLITERLADTSTLADRLKKAPQPEAVWLAVGRCIRRFHDANVFHADLNANNILLDGQGQVYLIDFDQGCFRKPGSWKQHNVARLLRSLKKIQDRHPNFHFSHEDWLVLLQGYEDAKR